MEKKNEFKPYIPAEKVTSEITVVSVLMGIILALYSVRQTHISA